MSRQNRFIMEMWSLRKPHGLDRLNDATVEFLEDVRSKVFVLTSFSFSGGGFCTSLGG